MPVSPNSNSDENFIGVRFFCVLDFLSVLEETCVRTKPPALVSVPLDQRLETGFVPVKAGPAASAGFTLIELVIALIGILAAMLLPALARFTKNRFEHRTFKSYE